MARLLGLTAVLLGLVVSPAGAARPGSATPLPQDVAAKLRAGGYWHKGCPVGLSRLRLLTVAYRGFDGRSKTGGLVVNAAAVGPLGRAFDRLYRLHFPIRRVSPLPLDGDVTASFSCRQAVPSPCVGGSGTGTWSMHAFGLAVDVNPRENPYVGCGQSRDPATRRYFDRSIHRRGMVTRRAIGAFRASGWGWGGSWTGDTKDYMHFSSTGH